MTTTTLMTATLMPYFPTRLQAALGSGWHVVADWMPFPREQYFVTRWLDADTCRAIWISRGGRTAEELAAWVRSEMKGEGCDDVY